MLALNHGEHFVINNIFMNVKLDLLSNLLLQTKNFNAHAININKIIAVYMKANQT